MNIEWNRVTWYSKLIAVIIFILTFYVGFLLGQQNAEIKNINTTAKPFDITATWKTFSDTTQGITFKYPATIPTKYITLVDWPPKIQVIDSSFVCTNGGESITPTGQTSTQAINGHDYCVTTLVEGAAGSTYTQYGYVASIQGKFVSFAFTLRATQCANYSDPQKTACEKERVSFSINPIIDQILQTAKLSS